MKKNFIFVKIEQILHTNQISVKLKFQRKNKNICLTIHYHMVMFEIFSSDVYHNKVKEQGFYFCSTFHSHSRVFNDEHNSYPQMSVNWPLAGSWMVLFISADKPYTKASLSFWCYLVYGIVFPRCGVINNKTKYRLGNLTNTVIIVPVITFTRFQLQT